MPRSLGNAIPQLASRNRLHGLAGRAGGEGPLAIGLDGAQEVVGHPNGVVSVLAGNRDVGFGLPVRVERRKVDMTVALARKLDDALDVVFGQLRAPCRHDFMAQLRVLLGIERGITVDVGVEAGAHYGVEMPVGEAGARDECRDLLLFQHLPGDELLDVRVIDVDGHHLRGPSRRSAGLDGSCCPVSDLEEGHQARGLAATRQAFAVATQAREVGARPGSVLEQARFAHPEIHDAAFVHQVVRNALDEAGVRLRSLIGGVGRVGNTVTMIDVPVTLPRAVDAVGPMQAGVEPLGRIRRANLRGQHVAMLVVEGASIGFGVKVAALPAPVGPRAGHAFENLACAALAAVAHGRRHRREADVVRLRAPQPFRDVGLGNLDQEGGNAGPAKILLGENVGRHLRPGRRHVDALELEHHRAIRIADFRVGSTKRHSLEW